MRKLSSTEAELKKALLIKKVCISLVPLMIPLEVGVKAYLIYLLFPLEFRVVFA